jgi:aminoglycoside phosphotransferase (APT) family kinase protein
MTSAAAVVPSSIDEVTPRWLAGALRLDSTLPDDLTVAAVRAEQIAKDTGFSALLYRVHLTGSAGIPSTLIVKLPAQSAARGAMEMLGGYRKEVHFYAHLAADAPMATPHCYVARMAETSTDFVLVLEDLTDWENADHLIGLSLDRVRQCITVLAGLHAWSVGIADEAVLQEFPGLDTPIARDLFLPVFAPAWQVYLDKTTQPVPAAVAAFADRFAELAPQAFEALSERSMLLHGDIRADNLFFRPGETRGAREEDLKVVDFQMTVRGAGAADIAYLVSQGLPTEVRRGNDEQLLRDYLGDLADAGVGDYSFDEAWRHYRFAVAYLMYLPVIILISWDSLPERSRQLCVALVDRAVAAIDDIGALEVFE